VTAPDRAVPVLIDDVRHIADAFNQVAIDLARLGLNLFQIPGHWRKPSSARHKASTLPL
jgi:hypothetical protein